MGRHPPVIDQNPDGSWTITTVHEHLESQVEALNRADEEMRKHFDALLSSYDKRYEERYQSSQTALRDALLAAQTAVNAALTAAKEAVLKAEAAADKRFEGINELRGMAGDFARLSMPRLEAESATKAMTDKVEALAKSLTEKIEAAVKSINEKAVSDVRLLTEKLDAQKAEIDGLKLSRSAGEGKQASSDRGIYYLFSAAALLVGVLGVLTHYLH